jgi:hypothetical protein
MAYRRHSPDSPDKPDSPDSPNSLYIAAFYPRPV